MALNDPLSLREVRQLAGSADTILLTATRNADLETPIGAFMRFDDGGPAFLLESVEGGERLGRYSFLGVGPRRLLTVRDGVATIQPAGGRRLDFVPDLPTETFAVRRPARGPAPVPAEAPRPARRGHAAVPGRRGRRARYDAVSTFEPTVPLPDADPIGVRWPRSRRPISCWSSTT